MGACSGCGSENRDDAQFCASCGGALAPVCPSCGASARPDARFCDRCGTELGAAASGGGAQSRKVVTVLFADLVGSTAAQETMDPESVRRWIDRYYAVLRSEVERHGGRVVKFIGDGMMAVFGVPDVREDDAERAVAAAQAMHDAVAELGSTVADGAEIGLRVGVNTGEVVVTADDDDVVGDVVNVAARLEQAARPGEVLVGDATFRLVRTRAQLRAVPPLELKGKAEPVPAFLLLSLEQSEEDTAASPFVGRAGEIERLTAVLDVAIDDRRPQLASIIGAPGVGKSRLVQELGGAAADRARVVVVRCDPAGGATFAPVAAAIRVAASLDDDATDETVVAGLTALFDDEEPDRHRIATSAAAILGVGEPGLPEETFWAVRRLIENAARRGPLVFVFEDVHWAEPLLIDLIENLATFARDVPVLMVVTARPELREQRPGLVEVGGRVAAVIHLEGLAVDESRRLTRALLDGASLPTALLDRVASASEGNPLFVRELVRMLVDDGVLQQQDGSWTSAVDARTVEVPLSIHSVLAARIDRLPPGEQEVLSAASVMGRTFARGAVLHLVSPEVGAHLEDHLEGLRRKELVERAGTYWLDEPQLRFHHALVQDAAYRRLLKEARAELHTKAAAWLEAKIGDLAEHDDLIGFQLEQAHLLRTEAGEGDEGVGRAAAERLRQAGRRSLEADDRPGAAALLGRALTCLPDDDDLRPELLIEQCEALLAMGDVTDATPSVAALAAIAPGDPRLEGWAACFEGELANLRDPRHLEATADRCAAAAVALTDLGDNAGVAKAHSVRAASLARLGRIGECERALDQALGAARAAGDRRRATAILAGAPTAALWGPNPVTRASGRCLDVVRVLRITSRAPAVEAISLRCQAVLEALRGRDDAARRMLASARGSLEELGHALGLIEVDLAAGMVETLAGDLDTAAKLLERAFEGFHELGIDVDAGLAAALLARVRIAQGAPAEALALTLESERLGGEDLKTAIAWRSVRAAALADEGDLTEARRLAEEAVALAAPTDALVDHADALVALAEVLAHSGDEAASANAARQALELYDRKEATVPADHARWLVGEGPVGSPRLSVEPTPSEDVSEPARSTVATRLAASVVAATSPFDRAAMSLLLAPDVVNRDHRPIVGSGEPLDMLESAQTVYDIGVREVQMRVLAVRGEHLVLIEASFILPPSGDSPGGHLEILQLFGATPDGRLGLNLIFDPDQHEEAWTELDRQAELDAPSHEAIRSNLAVEVAMRAAVAMSPFDRDALEALVSPDLVMYDHRPLVGSDEPQDMVESAVTIDAIGVRELKPTLLAVRGDLLALLEVEYVAPASDPTDDVRLTLLHIMEAGHDGRLVRNLAYEPEQAAEAWAALEQRYCEHLPPEEAAVWSALRMVDGRIASGDHLPDDRADLAAAVRSFGQPGPRTDNAATRSLARIGELDFEVPSVDEFLAACREDVVLADHRALVGTGVAVGREEWGRYALALHEIGVRSIDFQVRGLRGERLALGVNEWRGAGGSTQALVAVEVDHKGLLAGFHIHDLDRSSDAWGELERLYLAELDPAAAEVWASCTPLLAAMIASDWPGMRAQLADDFVGVDHREASGWGRVDREEYVGLYVTAVDLAPDAWFGFTDVYLITRRGVAGAGEGRGTTVDGGEFRTAAAIVFEVADGRVTGTTYFPADRPDLAVEHLRSLDGSVPRGVLGNQATGAYEAVVERVMAGDIAAVADTVRPDVRLTDHRFLIGGDEVLGTEQASEWSAVVAELFDRMETEVVAVRGERLGLVRTKRIANEATSETLVLCETDEHGLGRSLDTFDVTQLDDAMALLEDRFTRLTHGADTPSLGNQCTRHFEATLQAFFAGEIEDLADIATPAIRITDHRPVLGGWEVVGLEAARSWLEGITAVGFTASHEEALAVRGERLGLVHITRTSDGVATDSYVVLETDATGRGSAIDAYEASQLDVAMARLDERFRELESGANHPGIENDVTRKYERAIRLALAGDADAFSDVRDDLVSFDHRPIMGGGDVIHGSATARAWVDGLAEMGFATAEMEVVAVRGERLGLIVSRRFADEATLEVLTVIEADEAGMACQIDVHDTAQLDEAMARLDERYADLLPTEHHATWQLVAGVVSAMNARDIDGMLGGAAERSVIVDHRPAGIGTLEKEGWPAFYRETWDQIPDVRWRVRRVREISTRAVYGDFELHGTNEGGAVTSPMLLVWEVVGGKVAAAHIFLPEDELEASALYEGLSATQDEGNEAVRAYRQAYESALSGDWDTALAWTRSDIAFTDHRPLIGGFSITGQAAVQAIGQTVRDAGVTRLDTTTVAMRGQRVALLRTDYVGTQGAVEALTVSAVDGEGRMTELSAYDLDQLDEAVARLDELFLAGEGAEHADSWRPGIAFLTAVSRRDLTQMEAQLSPDAVIEDHRPASFGRLGRDVYISSYPTAWVSAPDVRWMLRRDLESADGVVLVDMVMFGTRDGGAFESPQYLVGVIRDAQIQRMDVFGPDDLEAARACFAAARRETPVRRALLRYAEHANAGDPGGLQALFAPSAVLLDHRPLVGGEFRGADLARALETWKEVGATWLEWVPFASRGERLELARLAVGGSAAHVEILMLLRVDDDGALDRVEFFELEQTDDAIARLDELFLEQLPADHHDTWRATSRVVAAMSSHDPVEVRAAIGADGGLIDRRPLSWGDLGPDEWAAIFPSMWETAPDARYVITNVARIGPSATLLDLSIQGTREGGPFEVPIVIVLEMGVQRGIRAHTFTPEARSEAEARYEQLGGEADNAAVRAMVGSTELLLAGRLEDAASLYAPDIVMTDHRPIIGGMQIEGREAFAPTASSIFEWEFDHWSRRVLAVHGDHLALVQAVFGNADTEVEVILLADVDDEGRYQRLDVFDPDQLELARSVLFERATAPGPAETSVRRALTEYVGRIVALDLDGLRACFSTSGVIVDARPLVGGEYRGDELTSALRTWKEVGITGFESTPFATRGERLELTRCTVSGSATHVDILSLWRTGDDGVLDRVEIYDPEQVDDAFRRLDELFLAGEGDASEAWGVFVGAFDAMNARDVDALGGLIGQDFVAVDHRPLGWGQLGLEEYLGLYPPMFEQSPDARWRMTDARLVTHRVVVATVEVSGGYGDSGGFDIRFVSVLQTYGDLSARLEIFPLEEEAAALARARELTAEPDA